MSAHTLSKTNNSVRDKSKQQAQKKQAGGQISASGAAQIRPATRTVVENPYQLEWPSLSPSIRRTILDSLVTCLDSKTAFDGTDGDELSIREWREGEHRRKRMLATKSEKGKEVVRDPLRKSRNKRKHSPTKEDLPASGEGMKITESGSVPSLLPPLPKPTLLSHVSVGINDITRALESQIRWGRWELGDSRASPLYRPTPQKDEDKELRGRKRMLDRTAERKKDGKRVRRHSGGKSVETKKDGELKSVEVEHAPNPDIQEEEFECTPVPPELSFLFERSSPSISTSSPPYLVPATASHPPLLLPNAPSSLNSPISTAHVPLIDVIFVCKPDLNPVSLVAHFPTMVGAANGVASAIDSRANEKTGEVDAEAQRVRSKELLLVPLDKGAELVLSNTLGLRRVAAIGISSSHSRFHSLRILIETHLKPLQTPWLVPHLLQPPTTAHLIPTHVKHLQTTAPADLKGYVEKRKEEKKIAKSKKEGERKAAREKERKEKVGKAKVYMATD